MEAMDTAANASFEGFELHEEFRANEVVFRSPEEFWEAQAAIVTEARKRLLAASPEEAAAARGEFLRRARGKRLVYPYQARFIRARSRA